VVRGQLAWFTEPGVDRLAYATTSGAIVEFSTGITSGAAPQSLAVGPDNNIWFTEPGTDSIGRLIPASGQITEFRTGISPGAIPLDIAAGSDGALWFTESGLRKIGRIDVSGNVIEYDAGFAGFPHSIAPGIDGMYFTQPAGNAVSRIQLDNGYVTRATLGIAPSAAPTDISPGPNGLLWFTEPGTGNLGSVAPFTMNVTEYGLGLSGPENPTGIGRDGATLLITQAPADKVTQRAADGTTVDLGISPSAGSTPTAIADGDTEHSFWFTEPARNSVAYVALAPPPPPPPPPPLPPAPQAKGNPNLELQLESEEASPAVVKATPAKKTTSTGKRRVCYVPRLKLRTISGARKILKKNRCRVGKITRKGKSRKGLKFRVTSQSRKVHLRTTFNSKVNFTVAPRHAPKTKKK
jgi:streptogramin lyase